MSFIKYTETDFFIERIHELLEELFYNCQFIFNFKYNFCVEYNWGGAKIIL